MKYRFIVKRWFIYSVVTAFAVHSVAYAQLPVPCSAGACSGPNSLLSQGSATVALGNNSLTIQQHSDRVTLNWQSFNIGAGNSVNFRQPSETAIALNRIFQADASVIQGALNANGQVYLINQNGILFNAGSQVNVHSLVASTLDIDDDIFQTIGLVDAINDATEGRPAFQHAGEGEMGGIEIEAGAKLTSGEGGRIMVFAPKIKNAGHIETPDGQTILAAAEDEVYLAVSDDADLRGLLVGVNTGGSVENLGEILAKRGNISLAGLAVNQNGIVQATTSVNLNGSIKLLAQDQVTQFTGNAGDRKPLSTRGGELLLGSDSRTQVLPELTSTDTAIDAQDQPKSTVELRGERVTLQENAEIVVPSGRVDIKAALDPSAINSDQDETSRIKISRGALINVSGTESTLLSVNRNIVEVDARGNELRDAPFQRDGKLFGKKISIDVRKGTDVLDYSGALSNIRRDVGERSATGGIVNMSSTGEVDIEKNAIIDVSGGKVTYEADTVQTTKLLSDGRLYDISEADPNIKYDAVFAPVTVKNQKWGTQRTYNLYQGIIGRTEDGYIEGKDAGDLYINARSIKFEGQLNAKAKAGIYQRLAPQRDLAPLFRPYNQRPVAGLLSVTLDTRNLDLLPRIVIADEFIPSAVEREQIAHLPPSLIEQSGVGNLILSSAGGAEFLAGGGLTLPAFGRVSVNAPLITVGSPIYVPSGSVTLNAELQDNRISADRVGVYVNGEARLDVSGTWINENPQLDLPPTFAPLATGGGDVTITALGQVALAEGSVIAANGGARYKKNGQISAGVGGSISLYSAPLVNETTLLSLNGVLQAYGLTQGGSLAIAHNAFLIHGDEPVQDAAEGVTKLASSEFFTKGGFSSYTLNANLGGIELANNSQLLLDASNYVLRPGHELVASTNNIHTLSNVVQLPEHQRGPVALTLLTKANNVNLLNAKSDIVLGVGSLISATPQSTINLNSETSIYIDGEVIAPAGNININLGAAHDLAYDGTQGIWLGEQSRLLTDATAYFIPNRLNLRLGEVLPAGSIALTARRGSIITETGSQMSANGMAVELDLLANNAGGERALRSQVSAAAGEIRLSAAETIILNGDVVARAADGSDTAAGGHLAITLDPTQRNEDPAGVGNFPHSARVIQLGQLPDVANAIDLVQRNEILPEILNGRAVVPTTLIAASGVDSLELNAKPSVYLPDQRPTDLPTEFDIADTDAVIQFQRDNDLTLRRSVQLDAPTLRVDEGVEVSITAPYIAVGPSDRTKQYVQSEVMDSGSGSLKLSATSDKDGGGLLELINHVEIHGVGRSLDSSDGLILVSGGDLRLRGMREPGNTVTTISGGLRVSGNVTIDAAQLYATTLSEFDLAVEAENGVLRIEAADKTVNVPLSAGSRLTLAAPFIEQKGVVRAPFGEIVFNADRHIMLAEGSESSVSGAGLLVPFGRSQFNEDLVFPVVDQAGLFRVINQLPEKSVALSAPEVTIQKGAVVDLSGGGELRAFEFVPGPGGSSDILTATFNEGAFAVLPSLNSRFAPYDLIESPQFGSAVGETVYLADGIAGLSAGEYAKLPPRYALYGGFLLTPASSVVNLLPGSGMRRTDGIPIVAAKDRVAGSGIEASRWQGYLVENGSQVRQRAEYVEFSANDLLATSSTLDAGSLVLEAGSALTLAGTLKNNAAGGRGVHVDIAAERLAIVNVFTDDRSRVELLTQDVMNLGADSLFVGGRRISNEGETHLDVTSTNIDLTAGVVLRLPEMMFAAQEGINVESGVRLLARGEANVGGNAFSISSTPAFIALSTGDSNLITRQEGATLGGNIKFARGAHLEAPGSLVMDAGNDFEMLGTLQTSGVLALGAAKVSLGDTGRDVNEGLILSNYLLEDYSNSDLSIRSNGSIDLYGNISATFDTLNLEARALQGQGISNGQTVRISAGTLVLKGNDAEIDGEVVGNKGTLEIDAEKMRFDGGVIAINGFATSRLSSAGMFEFAKSGQLSAAGDLDIHAQGIVASRPLTATVESAGKLALLPSTVTADLESVLQPALASRLSFVGDSLTVATRIDAPAGDIILRARGTDGLSLTDGANIMARGSVVDFAEHQVAVGGGEVRLVADVGNMVVKGGNINIDVSAEIDTLSEGGTLTISAPRGEFVVDENVALKGGGGAIALDVNSLNNLAELNVKLAEGGFNRSREIRLRSGDITIGEGEVIKADHIMLVADNGAIDVRGALDASKPDGGRIELAARGNLVLSTTARLDARGSGMGGKIYLSSTESELDLAQGSLIDVGSQQGSASQGYLRLTAPRIGNSNVAINNLLSTINGAKRIDVEAVARYNASTGLIDDVVETSRSDISDFITFVPEIKTELGGGEEALHIVPGVEIFTDGELSLNTEWDLFNWREGGEPGILSVRAAKALTFNQSLSDGFEERDVYSKNASGAWVRRAQIRLMDDKSWSYSLVAGADLTSARRTATATDPYDLIVGDQVIIRTGSGDIDLVASGDIRLVDETSVVYTAGRSGGFGDLDKLTFENGDELVGFGEAFIFSALSGAEFPLDGGDLTIRAGGDIIAQAPNQLYTEWLPRMGGGGSSLGAVPTSWGVRFQEPRHRQEYLRNKNSYGDEVGPKPFRQAFAALGGGDVTVKVDGDIKNASFSIPTSGKAMGEFEVNGNLSQPFGDVQFIPSNGRVEVNGGGKLQLDVGGDIVGGAYYIGRGDANIRARGAIGNQDGITLALGDAKLGIVAGRDLNVTAVVSPTMLNQPDDIAFPTIDKASYFYTFGEQSTVNLESLGGEITLLNNIGAVAEQLGNLSIPNVYPGKFRTVSYTGGIGMTSTNGAGAYLYPSKSGRLEVLAKRDIVNLNVLQSDANEAFLPAVANPWAKDGLRAFESELVRHSAVPVHKDDDAYNLLVSDEGSIKWLPRTIGGLNTAMQTRLFAALDIENFDIKIQHANPSDISEMIAGRDIVQHSVRNLTGQLSESPNGIEVFGVGRIDLLAGRHIDLGTSRGVRSAGNSVNPNLPSEGASILLLAGLTEQPNYTDFRRKYLEETTLYTSKLATFLAGDRVDFDTDDDHAAPEDRASLLEAFSNLTVAEQRGFIVDLYFNELKLSGVVASQNGDYSRGNAAINTLFAADSYQGDIRSLLSQIITLNSGDIDMLVPGGMINAGAATSEAIQKSADRLGIISAQGNLRGYIRDDMLVNQSRVFALEGDLVLWSALGDLDAGRGAKTAVSIPKPTVAFDEKGNITVVFPPAVAGSGLLGRNAFLFAPSGVINAGDAGIRATENLTISAVEVIGADNIDVGGVAIGVPTGDNAVNFDVGVGDVASNVTKEAEKSLVSGLSDAATARSTPLADEALSFLEVVVEGFGDNEKE